MHLLFDLDGTLTDSFPGISQSVNHALVEVGREPVPDAQLRPLVGAPLRTIFRTLLGATDLVVVNRVVATYRARFDEVGILENRVFPGIPTALNAFRSSGHTLQVVTARSAVSARHVVRHFALDSYFEAVHGPEPRGPCVRQGRSRARGSTDGRGVGGRCRHDRGPRR